MREKLEAKCAACGTRSTAWRKVEGHKLCPSCVPSVADRYGQEFADSFESTRRTLQQILEQARAILRAAPADASAKAMERECLSGLARLSEVRSGPPIEPQAFTRDLREATQRMVDLSRAAAGR